MKVPTMDQLRIQHELAMSGARAEWEELWNQISVYGRAYARVEGPTCATEQYGRGDTAMIIGARMKPMITACYERWFRRVDWDDSLVLEDFPRSALADAVANAVEP